MLQLIWRGVLSAVFLVGLRLHGAPIMIDSFNNTIHFASVGFAPGTLSASSGTLTAGGESVGGARFFTITRTGDGNDSINVSSTLPGTFNFNLAANDIGTGLIIWDGDSNSTIDHGLSVDLTSGGLNAHIQTSVRSDLVAPVVVTVYSGAGNFSTFTFSSPGLGFAATPYTVLNLAFAGFTVGGGSGANFASVTAVTLFVDGSSTPGLDFQIDYIQASEIPEPATFAVIGLGLAGIGFAGLRRRL